MTRTIMVLIALMIMPLLTVSSDRTAVAQGGNAPYCEMLRHINDLRQDHGLPPLTLSQPLTTAAEVKASDMAERNYFAHMSPDGVSPRELLESVGYTYNTSTGENIAAGNEGAAATFNQWLNSPSHFDIMVGEQFTAIGIGRAYNPDARYDWYWAAEFGGVVGAPATTCGTEPPVPTPDEPPAPNEAIIATIIAIILEILASQTG